MPNWAHASNAPTRLIADVAPLLAALVAAQAENERLATALVAEHDAFREMDERCESAEADLAAARSALAAAETRIEKALALLDEWQTKAGPESSVWEVFGPQSVSVPFAVESVRAALAAPTPQQPKD